MIRIAICDDEITSLELLHHLVCTHLKKRVDTEFLVRRFQSVYDLLECLETPKTTFNVYFLDIIMPMYSGIEVARMIRANDEDAVIVFTTASREYVMDAIATAPLQYLLKPIDVDQLHAVLDRAIRKVGQMDAKNLLIKRKEGLSNVGLHQIETVEYRDHALTFHLRDGRSIDSRVVNESFSWFAENVLNDPRFIKPHASFIVNMDQVESMTSKEFTMYSGAVVPISKRIAAQVKQQYVDYMTRLCGAMVI